MEQGSRPNKGVAATVVALLVLILATQVFTILSTLQQNRVASKRAATYQARVETAQKVVDRQQDVIFDLVTDYHASAYDSPDVIDRITEQQLLAAEYQLTALQIIAIQNSQILELLATAQ